MQKLRIKGCGRALAALLLALLAGYSACPALAANAEAILSLPISQRITGGNAAVRYQLQASESDAPLPDGAEDVYTFSLEDSVNGNIAAIRFDREGTWHYELSVLGAENSVELLSSVPRRYRITVEVDEQSGKLYALAVVYDPSGDKRDQLDFEHAVAGPTPTPTGTPVATETPIPTVAPTPTPRPAPAGAGGASVGTSPKTGDDANLPLYIGVMCATALAICIILILRKKKKA